MGITYTEDKERFHADAAGLRDVKRALHWKLHWKTRFRIARSAHGWIIEDLAYDGEVSAAVGRKISFHSTLESANAALLRVRIRAREGLFPVPIEKLLAVSHQFEERICMLQHELQLNGRPHSRHAKNIRNWINKNTQMLAGVRRQIEKLSRKGAP